MSQKIGEGSGQDELREEFGELYDEYVRTWLGPQAALEAQRLTARQKLAQAEIQSQMIVDAEGVAGSGKRPAPPPPPGKPSRYERDPIRIKRTKSSESRDVTIRVTRVAYSASTLNEIPDQDLAVQKQSSNASREVRSSRRARARNAGIGRPGGCATTTESALTRHESTVNSSLVSRKVARSSHGLNHGKRNESTRNYATDEKIGFRGLASSCPRRPRGRTRMQDPAPTGRTNVNGYRSNLISRGGEKRGSSPRRFPRFSQPPAQGRKNDSVMRASRDVVRRHGSSQELSALRKHGSSQYLSALLGYTRDLEARYVVGEQGSPPEGEFAHTTWRTPHERRRPREGFSPRATTWIRRMEERTMEEDRRQAEKFNSIAQKYAQEKARREALRDEADKTDVNSLPKEISDFKDRFSEEAAKRLPKHSKWDMKIELMEGAKLPGPGALYQPSPADRKAIGEWIQKDLEKGWI